MKKIYLFLLVLVAVFVACKKDMDVEFSTFEVENEKISPSYTSTELSCKVRCTATINELYLQYDTVADFATYQEVEFVENEKTEVYSVKIGDLLDNTTYYVRYVAVNSYSQVTSEEVSEFKTLQATVPTIEVREITDVLDTIATVGLLLKFDGGADITKMGVCWSMDSVPTIDGEHVECCSDVVNSVSDGDLLFLNISGLEENTTYYVRAYAENMKGVGYSESKAFVTLTLPEVKTGNVSEIQYTSAVLHGEAIFDGNDPATIYGFCWSEEENPTLDDANIQVSKTIFSYRLSNLLDETKYYVRAYAKNKIGLVYGDVKEFTTQSTTLPIVVTSAVTEIEYTSAVVTGNVTSDGGAEVTERGVCYSKTQNPTISDTKIILGKGFGYFLAALSDLQDETTYYVRAYAINKKGVSYGKQISFATKATSLPVVVTSSVTDITYTSATIGGNVMSDGAAEVTERGVCYSTTFNPTINNLNHTTIVVGSGVGNFSTTISNLIPDGKTYYIRAYAKNKKGVSYGEEFVFATREYTLPIIEAIEPTNISYTSATVGGSVTSDGGTEVTERGVCYSTLGNPTIVDSKVIVGKGMGSFTIILSDLQVGTKYYMRAYAINSVGIAYGEIVVFTTLDYIEAGHRYVDLGLSVKWATCNVGATKPEEYGDYFAWGEVEPKDNYSWSTYKYCYGSYDTMNKYYIWSNGLTDNKIVLDAEDDVATVKWGGAWRMPTKVEQDELRNNCLWMQANINGVYGYKVIGTNGNSIFLPATGCMQGRILKNVGSIGLFFSNTLVSDISYVFIPCGDAYNLRFDSYGVDWNYIERSNGLVVRPVCK